MVREPQREVARRSTTRKPAGANDDRHDVFGRGGRREHVERIAAQGLQRNAEIRRGGKGGAVAVVNDVHCLNDRAEQRRDRLCGYEHRTSGCRVVDKRETFRPTGLSLGSVTSRLPYGQRPNFDAFHPTRCRLGSFNTFLPVDTEPTDPARTGSLVRPDSRGTGRWRTGCR